MRHRHSPFAVPFTFTFTRWSLVLLLLLGLPRTRAAEYIQNGTYGSTAYTTSVYHDDSIPSGEIRGVIVAFNYGGADQAYTKAIWRNFAKDRSLALCLMANQDTFGTPAYVPDGMSILNGTLNNAATALAHPELASSTLPLIFVGISRGGTSGAINFGWNYGAQRTVACIAYHGNSFNYLDTSFLSTTTATVASAIPVLYPVAQLDSGPYRQTDIETAVRTTNTTTLNGSIGATSFGYRPRYGLYWTTTMQYGSSHASLGDDTYPLQWLGRVWAARYNPATPGTLSSISTANSSGGAYTLTNGASNQAYYASPTTTTFTAKNGNVWIPPGGASEWLADSSQPLAGTAYNIDTASATIYTAPDQLTNRSFIGAGTLTFSGAGTIALDNGSAGNKNSFKMTGGTIQIRNGVTLKNGAFQGGDWSQNKASLQADATATLDLSDGTAVQVDALNGSGFIVVGVTSGSQTLTVGNNGGSGTYAGVISGGATATTGAIALVKTGSGTQTLNGANSYTGGTTVNGGRLTVGTTGRLGTGDLVVNAGATVTLANAAGAIADTAGVTLNGTGKLDLAAGVIERVASLTVDGVAMAKGIWSATRDPLHFSGSGQLLVATVGATAVQDWRLANFGTSTNTGTAADDASPARDGLSNLLKFATGLAPTKAATAPGTIATGAGPLTFTYRRSHIGQADGTQYLVEWSDTLMSDWTSTGVTHAPVAGTDDGFTQAYVATLPNAASGQRFIRLRVVHP